MIEFFIKPVKYRFCTLWLKDDVCVIITQCCGEGVGMPS
jgi:hypothetical protein